jgi:hypothetical protein
MARSVVNLLDCVLTPALELEPGHPDRTLWLSIGYSFCPFQFFSHVLMLEDGSWDQLCGEGGCLLIETLEAYDYHRHHKRVSEIASLDGNVCGAQTLPLIQHYGNLSAANAAMDVALANLKVLRSTPDTVGTLAYLQACACAPVLLYMLGRKSEAADLMRKLKVDWHNVEATVDVWARRLPTVGTSEDSLVVPSDLVWSLRSLYCLCADDEDSPASEEIAGALPNANTLAMLGVKPPGFHPAHVSNSDSSYTSFWFSAPWACAMQPTSYA